MTAVYAFVSLFRKEKNRVFNILVVDDEEIVRKGLISAINTFELEIENVFEAENGETALSQLKELSDIHAVITDIKMPGLDGVSLVREVKKIFPDMPMVIVSGYNDYDYLRQAIRHGVSDYLLKPIDPIELGEVLSAALAKAPKQSGESSRAAIRQNTLFRLVEGTISKQELSEKSEAINLPQLSGTFQICHVEGSNNPNETANDLNKKLIEENFGVAFLHPTHGIICILCGTADEDEKKAHLLSLFEATDNLAFRFGVLVDDVESIAFSFGSLFKPEPLATYSKTIRDALAYSDKHFTENIALKQLADILYISPSYLGTLFKKEVGIPFTDYVNKKRVDLAETMLEQTNLKIYEIVEQVGFSDKNYFLRLFKRYKGKPPSAYRK